MADLDFDKAMAERADCPWFFQKEPEKITSPFCDPARLITFHIGMKELQEIEYPALVDLNFSSTYH
ncbi:MAG: hypothetical protein IPL46_24975 [Saprospiraceae bacterium]|nr:hypothetical protein [Saprospiraceae bacterium]